MYRGAGVLEFQNAVACQFLLLRGQLLVRTLGEEDRNEWDRTLPLLRRLFDGSKVRRLCSRGQERENKQNEG